MNELRQVLANLIRQRNYYDTLIKDIEQAFAQEKQIAELQEDITYLLKREAEQIAAKAEEVRDKPIDAKTELKALEDALKNRGSWVYLNGELVLQPENSDEHHSQ
jgi:hypothetical protein